MATTRGATATRRAMSAREVPSARSRTIQARRASPAEIVVRRWRASNSLRAVGVSRTGLCSCGQSVPGKGMVGSMKSTSPPMTAFAHTATGASKSVFPMTRGRAKPVWMTVNSSIRRSHNYSGTGAKNWSHLREEFETTGPLRVTDHGGTKGANCTTVKNATTGLTSQYGRQSPRITLRPCKIVGCWTAYLK
jgi:hypothetical protein